ncbi:MAG: hypothetical protein MR270_05710 [Erysipelotrichaceae bacterium]|nr:hypothetical protein [Erysipelotrichaceae bacterium]
MKKTNKIFNSNLNADFNRIASQINYDEILDEKRKINTKKIVYKSVMAIALIIPICIILLPLVAFIEIDESAKMIKKSYSLNEIKNLQNESFVALNEVNYPNITEKKEQYKVDETYKNAINNFANLINSKVTLDEKNVVYSPLSLYSMLDIMSLLSNDEETLNELDNLLNASKSIRNENYDNMYKNNYYLTNEGTTQMYNGLFVRNNQTFNVDLLDDLSNKYTEVFSLNFDNNKDIDRMLKWVDKRIDESGFLKKEDLQIKEDTVMFLFSTLYYKNTWRKEFLKDDSYSDVFYGNNNESDVTYMKHSYYSNQVYDYDSYISFKDYYCNGYCIKYIVPKSLQSNIYDEIKNVNIFVDDEEKKMTYINELNQISDSFIIDLSLPRFKVESFIDFNEILKKSGLNKAYDYFGKSFNYAFSDLKDDESIYLQYVKQKNAISFDEDGTIAKSVSFASFGKNTSAVEIVIDTLEVKLNQPFIYIIEDSNSLPLFVGSVNQL